MQVHRGWGVVLAGLLSLASPAAAVEPAPIAVAQASDCKLARDMWADLKSTSSQGALRAFIAQAQDCPVYVMLAEELLGELDGEPSATVPPAKTVTLVPETDCDRLAGYTFHPRIRGLSGVETADLDADAAIPACAGAVMAHPQESFFSLLLARAYQKVDASDPRIETLIRKGMEGHRAFALSRLGLLYARGGAGLAADPVQAAEHARQSCNLGDATGCNNLGTSYGNGTGVAENQVLASELYLRACELGLDVGCNNLAHNYRNGAGVDRDLSEATSYFGLACEGGWNDGCAQLNAMGIAYEKGEGVTADLLAASDLYRRSCERDVAAGCENLARMYRGGLGVDRDLDLAGRLYRETCIAGSASSCGELGLMYMPGQGYFDGDYLEAARWFGLSCELGAANRCEDLAELYIDGLGVEVDYVEAARLSLIACENDSAYACRDLGWLYSGMAKNDYREAAKYYVIACDADLADACYELANMHYYAKIKSDPSTIAEMFRRSCDVDIRISAVRTRGCYELGTFYLAGTGVEKNNEEAYRLFRLTCRLDSVACDKVEELSIELGRGPRR